MHTIWALCEENHMKKTFSEWHVCFHEIFAYINKKAMKNEEELRSNSTYDRSINMANVKENANNIEKSIKLWN